MAKGKNHSRRNILAKLVNAGLVMIGANSLAGCENKKETNTAQSKNEKPVSSCDDLTGVSESDLGVRKKLGYVEESPIAENKCHNCNLYLPPKPAQQCGGCVLFKGPVFTDAYCTYWAPKV